MSLPTDLSAAPLDLGDLDEAAAFVREASFDESGRVHFSREDLHFAFTSPGFDLERDTRVIRDAAGAIVALEWLRTSSPFVSFNAIGFVAPDRCGEGVGTALLDWARDTARSRVEEAPPEARVTLSAGVDSSHQPSNDLMLGYGMEKVRDFLEMRIDFDGPVVVPPLPDGLVIRGFVADEDAVATHQAIDDAFRDHYGYVERPLEEGLKRFTHWMSKPDTDFSLWWLAVDGDEIVGNCLCEGSADGDDAIGYVRNIGVRRPWRGRGLAKAMLLTAFAEFQERGKTSTTLHVDAASKTGATRLYEAVGMRETARYPTYEIELRPGTELIVR